MVWLWIAIGIFAVITLYGIVALFNSGAKVTKKVAVIPVNDHFADVQQERHDVVEQREGSVRENEEPAHALAEFVVGRERPNNRALVRQAELRFGIVDRFDNYRNPNEPHVNPAWFQIAPHEEVITDGQTVVIDLRPERPLLEIGRETLRFDPQNTHDSGVTITTKAALEKIRAKIGAYNMDGVLQRGLAAVGPAASVMQKIINRNQKMSLLGGTESEILTDIWQYIETYPDAKKRAEMTDALKWELADCRSCNRSTVDVPESLHCSTGCMTRVIQAATISDEMGPMVPEWMMVKLLHGRMKVLTDKYLAEAPQSVKDDILGEEPATIAYEARMNKNIYDELHREFVSGGQCTDRIFAKEAGFLVAAKA